MGIMSTENTQDTGNEVNIEEIKNTLIEKGYVVQSKEEHENYPVSYTHLRAHET